VAGEGLRLSVYVGERDQARGRPLSDLLIEAWQRAGVRSALLLRGVEGFGLRHRAHTAQLLTLSEDLPVLAVALDAPARVLGLLDEVGRLTRHGLVTLERVQLLDGPGGMPPGEVRLTLLASRGARAGRVPAHVAAVAAMRRAGMSGAAALLAVDGVAAGLRVRARLLARNAAVPILVDGVGEAAAAARALEELSAVPGLAPLALERARVCRRDGEQLAPPHGAPPEARGLRFWQKVVVQSGERDAVSRHPLHGELVRRLRREGAAGATALRSLWGYGGAHEPHGERLLALTRDTPVQTVICDTPEGVLRWWPIVEELTARTGLVTSELLPALRAGAPGVVHGGLELADPQPPPE
jgi:PII-like signaling protein